MTYDIQRYAAVACPDLDELEELADREGHSFIARTRREWEAGINCFDQPGESFFIALTEERTVGMCGLNSDPYIDDPVVGRLRHLYVHPSHRRTGMAAALVERCLATSGSFDRIRLRTSNPAADTLYRSLGFAVVEDSSATHEWRLPAGPKHASG